MTAPQDDSALPVLRWAGKVPLFVARVVSWEPDGFCLPVETKRAAVEAVSRVLGLSVGDAGQTRAWTPSVGLWQIPIPVDGDPHGLHERPDPSGLVDYQIMFE